MMGAGKLHGLLRYARNDGVGVAYNHGKVNGTRNDDSSTFISPAPRARDD